ncbi:hypothetical protein NHX12_033955 [Muraenolepis orangiensis]|uniref:Uncharacterized protein n=1 Tax=Muraenolepis orangiensis TaxID=630683 RepID=A0A9Q0E6K8_9TELE|nr:hypothetical protein NHX12_033955 [Muraenolepis orangiensis]
MLDPGSCSVSSESLTEDHHHYRDAPAGPLRGGGEDTSLDDNDEDVGLGPGTGVVGVVVCGSSTPIHYLLHPPPEDAEGWQEHRAGPARGSGPSLGSQLLPGPRGLSASRDTLYLPHMASLAPPSSRTLDRHGLSLDVAPCFEGGGVSDGDMAVSPNVSKRRRGGLIEQRDIVKAHQAHKIHSTPQARRKEWE